MHNRHKKKIDFNSNLLVTEGPSVSVLHNIFQKNFQIKETHIDLFIVHKGEVIQGS